MLKKNLVVGKNKPSLYIKLSQQTRSALQIQLLTYINEIDNEQLINQISDLLADMAASLYNDQSGLIPEGQKWGELVNHLFDLYKTGKIPQMCASLRMLDGIIDQTQEKLQVLQGQLKELIAAGFQCGNLKVQVGTFKLLSTIVIQFKPSITKNFKQFTDQYFKLVKDLLASKNEDELREAMAKVFDVCLMGPHFVKRKFGALIELMAEVREFD